MPKILELDGPGLHRMHFGTDTIDTGWYDSHRLGHT